MNIYTLSLISSSLGLIVVFYSIYQKKLEMKFSLFWIFSCIGMIILSLNQHILNLVAKKLHVFYAPSLLFLLGFLFVIGVVFQLTRIITKLDKRLIKLTQEFALLEDELKKEKSL